MFLPTFWLFLYAGGSLVLLVFAAWLAVTVYLYLLHRRYAHIPSPKMPRYFKVYSYTGQLQYAKLCVTGCLCFFSFYQGHLPVIIEHVGEEESALFLILKWYSAVHITSAS